MIFPDSGASICLTGPQRLEKKVGGSEIICHGWLIQQASQLAETQLNSCYTYVIE